MTALPPTSRWCTECITVESVGFIVVVAQPSKFAGGLVYLYFVPSSPSTLHSYVLGRTENVIFGILGTYCTPGVCVPCGTSSFAGFDVCYEHDGETAAVTQSSSYCCGPHY